MEQGPDQAVNKRAQGKRARDLSATRRWFLLILISIGSSIIYTPAYLKYTYYTQLMAALHISNEQVGLLMTTYAITATICYVPAGLLADRVRVRTLSTAGFITTALLVFWYAALPSFGVVMLIMVGMGITTIFIWWGVRYKLVLLISEEGQYSRNIGISYGFYGLAGMLVGFVIVWILDATGKRYGVGISASFIFLGALIFLLGVLSWLFIPKFADEIGSGTGVITWKDTAAALKYPAVWITAVSMFFVYFYYTCASYTTPYLTTGFGAGLLLVSALGNVRTYGITILSGPAYGWLAKWRFPSRVIWMSSILAALCFVLIAFLPRATGILVFVAILTIVLGFVSNGSFSVVSAQLTEAKVPIGVFGAATGILSIVGFLPDSFSSTWFGTLIDNHGNHAYKAIFLILAGSAVIATLSSMYLRRYVARHKEPLLGVASEPATLTPVAK
jgi:MFS family permease